MRRLLPALLFALALPAPAASQGVKRCTDAQGNTVFTDRSCASVDAVPKGVPAPAPGAYAEGFAPRGCARTAEALLQGVRTAREARDVNRLASFYHWPGTSSARGVMDALEEIANRPLVAVELAYPARPAPFEPQLNRALCLPPPARSPWTCSKWPATAMPAAAAPGSSCTATSAAGGCRSDADPGPNG